MANLNKGLITLTKLDNNQVEAASILNLDALINNRLSLFEDFILEKQLEIKLELDKEVALKINPALGSILFDNLIKNAVRHNVKQGTIKIHATKEFIKISNTGTPPTVDTNKFFERFFKDQGSESLGLGLAIVKKICAVYNFQIEYQFKDDYHTVTIHFF